jgi:hypothetical protein
LSAPSSDPGPFIDISAEYKAFEEEAAKGWRLDASTKTARKQIRRRRAILRLLVEKGPLNAYRICEQLAPKAGSIPTLLYGVRDLKEGGYIRVVEIDKRPPGGKPSEHYDLALLGLVDLITMLENNDSGRRFLDRLTNKYRSLMPSVFDVWPAISDAGIADLAFKRLRRVCLHFGEFIINESRDLDDEAVVRFFDPVGPDMGESREAKRWLRGILTNAALRERAKRSLRRTIATEEVSMGMSRGVIEKAEECLRALSKKTARSSPLSRRRTSL